MKWILFVLFLLLAVSVSAEQINLRSVRFVEYVNPGDVIPIYVSVKNIDSRDINDVYVRIESPEIDIFAISKDREIDDGDTETYTLPLYIPDVAPGDYYFRITITDNDDVRRHYWRILSIM